MNTNRSYFPLLLLQFDVDEKICLLLLRISSESPLFVVLVKAPF